MALYLEGKPSVDTNELSPKEATRMSHDVKYIGMDVHKEAIVIAVQNESGKLVMESVMIFTSAPWSRWVWRFLL
jgi:hypothetical protein